MLKLVVLVRETFLNLAHDIHHLFILCTVHKYINEHILYEQLSYELKKDKTKKKEHGIKSISMQKSKKNINNC